MLPVADTLLCIGLATAHLGAIDEAAGPAECCFRIVNAGAAPTAIAQAYTSCGCTTIDWPREAIAPADTAQVRLRFNPQGRGGEVYETATLVYGPQRKRLTLAFDADVRTSEETLARQYPIRVGDSLRLSANHFDLGRMRRGQKASRSIAALRADKRQIVTLTYTVPPDCPHGLRHDTIAAEAFSTRIDVDIDVFVE